jgi:ribosomal protein S18 acetylase RimI-like enzyme
MTGSSTEISYREAAREEMETVLAGLRGYNAQRVSGDFKPLLVVACRAGADAADGQVPPASPAIVGGLAALSYWAKMHVDNLWVADGFRGRGIGSRLMRMAEEVARQRACSGVLVDTMSFQALEFYQRLGYQEFGVIAGYAAGASRHYLHKPVGSPAG